MKGGLGRRPAAIPSSNSAAGLSPPCACCVLLPVGLILSFLAGAYLPSHGWRGSEGRDVGCYFAISVFHWFVVFHAFLSYAARHRYFNLVLAIHFRQTITV